MSATSEEIASAPLLLRGGAVSRHLIQIARSPTPTLAVVLVVGTLASGLFVSSDILTTGNMTLVLQALVPQLAVGLGVSVALYAGIVDLSIGAVMCVSAMTFAIVTQTSAPLGVALLAGLGVGVAVAAINSVLVVGLRVDPIIGTLAALLGATGMAFVIGGNASQPTDDFSWDLFVTKQIGAFPILFLVLVALYVMVAIYIKKSRIGRHLLGVGGGPVAARRLGVNVDRIQVGCLLAGSVGAAIAGMLSAGNVGAATVTLGVQDLYVVYSGILLGGFSIARGGVGTPLGGFLGIALLAMLLNIFSNASVAPAWIDLATGVILMIAVALDRVRYGAYAPT
jgi:ribose/xylose/arabinose/galactoside ABC-type transport system permease subunit